MKVVYRIIIFSKETWIFICVCSIILAFLPCKRSGALYHIQSINFKYKERLSAWIKFFQNDRTSIHLMVHQWEREREATFGLNAGTQRRQNKKILIQSNMNDIFSWHFCRKRRRNNNTLIFDVHKKVRFKKAQNKTRREKNTMLNVRPI